ncbi:EamA family transporter [Pseudooceanicola sp. 216_PA32_1]|uniref:EamA family transporter n=1 Tax=Pseudooceanicola pacificus TaxID=2676438 RepID=A0A844WB60_9RHOB|nr:DMT family transporter [Pseudooceanicola pacificus]MWB76470.1 EamA family transporter [Pseudooceanicola pacificus]
MNIRALALGLTFALLWSSAFTSARVIVAHAPPLGSLSLRFLISGAVGIALARMMGQSWHLTRAQWRGTAIFGVCQNAIYLGLFFMAMQTIEASLASIMASTMPLLVALAGWVVFRDRLPRVAVLGLVMGFGGVLVIMGGRLSGGADPTGVVLCVIGVVALTVATLSARGASSGGNVLMVVGLQMLIGGMVLAVLALMFETFEVRWSWQLVAAFVYTLIWPGLVATWIWFTLVNEVGTVRASVFHFLNPFFGVLVAAVVLGEAVGLRDVIGVVIVAAGILVVQLSRQKAAAPEGTA